MKSVAHSMSETSDHLYSNQDHVLNSAVLAELVATEALTLKAQHAAWDFCGYVYRGMDGRWHNEVWVYNEPVEDICGASAQEVIITANNKYGSG